MKKPTMPGRHGHRPQDRAAANARKPPSPPAIDARGVGRGAAVPIVGIGASAGGLEALELFLENVPANSGMAFVIVQHLDPTRKGAMPELLQRVTPMKVVEAQDGAPARRDCVYVIPPNKDLSILHGVLHLLDPVGARGLRLPVDSFFRSLADDAEDRAIGVILSGMGSDGTQGLRAIKAKAGVVFVQDPASAKFDGMPRSAIDAGLADVVAPAEALPGRIVAYLNHALRIAAPAAPKDDKDHSAFEKIVILLRAQTGHDVSLYKRNAVHRRIERRMAIHQIHGVDRYVRLLQENPKEVELLFKELLIGVTSFFRDPAAWEQLKHDVLPALLKDRPPNQTLRVWVPACATGEEAYSLAIAFQEALERLKPARSHRLQIFATDLDGDAVEKARAGVFPANIAADVSPERLARFFVQVERGYQVAKPVRETVIFAAQSIITDPPFTKLDMVSCRNVLIYLTPEVQKKLLPLFHYSLKPGGFLFLGSAETIGDSTDLFAPLPGQARLYRRLDSGRRTMAVDLPGSLAPARPDGPRAPKASKPGANLQSQAEQLLLQRYAPAAVLVNSDGDILFVSGRTGNYLEPAAGKANWNIHAMAREGLRHELTQAFEKALRYKGAVTGKSVRVRADGVVRIVSLTVETIAEPKALRGLVMVIFTEITAPEGAKRSGKGAPPGRARVVGLGRTLGEINQELLTTREEMQTSQEEARSANEELQSANEELQSTNEELTTSKEEMQSMNEELQTLNYELQAKVDNLSRLSSDMKNLLDSTEVAVLFLDTALCVRLFTPGSNRVFKLIPGDVGRPFTDIVSELAYPQLADDVREVLRTLVVHEQTVAARDGRWCLVRIMPYRTLENMIDGVAITFADVTASKTLEATLRTTQSGLEEHIAEQDVRLRQAGVRTGGETKS